MNRTFIPPINPRAAFYGKDVIKITEWFSQSDILSDVDIADMKLLNWTDAVEIVNKYYQQEEYKKLLHDRMLNDFSSKCGIGPSKTEEILQCTTTERRRWESEGKLPVVDHIETGTRKRPIWTPMYCRKTIESLNEDILDRWRAEHKASISESRRVKEEVKYQSKNVVVQVFKEGLKVYTIFGPVPVASEELELFWIKYKDKLPWDWDKDSNVVVMLDYNTNEVIRMQINSIATEKCEYK